MELYLDNAATTKLNSQVLEDYYKLLNESFASTGSLHSLGEKSLRLENEAKMQIASLLKVKPSEILFNSGATEGNNYAIKGVALNYKNRGNTLITTKVEHPSVLECFSQLEKEFGFKCIYLDVDNNGIVDLKQLESCLNNDVILVSIMYVNHEVGALNPIKKIGEMLKKYPKIIFHSDITQAICKTPIDLSYVDIATMSGHKIHALKGTGFMIKKEKVTLFPLYSGHPAFNALRAGTSNWPGNVVLAKALKLGLDYLKDNYNYIRNSQEILINKLSEIDCVTVNTVKQYSISHIINFSVPKYNSEVIIRALSCKSIYVSSRSVCTSSKETQISVTLNAMKKDIDVSTSSIRLSMEGPLDENQITYFIDSLKDVLKNIRR